MKSGGDTQVTERICFESWRSDPAVEERERQGTLGLEKEYSMTDSTWSP